MRNYRNNAGTLVRLRVGRELMGGLGFFEETAAQVPVVKGAQDGLRAAYDARMALEEPVIDARVVRRGAEWRLERGIRRLHGAARAADGDRLGPLANAAFPEGLSPVLAPRGQNQVSQSEQLQGRLAGLTLKGAEELKAGHLDNLAKLHSAFVDSLEGYEGAVRARDTAFTTEKLRRDDHRRTVQAVFGAIQTAFPGDTQIHAVIAPEVSTSRSQQQDDQDETTTEDEATP